MNSPLFGIVLSIIVYLGFVKLQQYLKLDILNPLLLSGIAIIIILNVMNIDFEIYNEGGKIISMLISPATVSLAIPLYKNLDVIKQNSKLILTGVITAVVVHAVLLILLFVALEADHEIALSLIPKSITTAIAADVSSSIGGIREITVASVIITGIVGAALSPILNKAFIIEDDKAIGLALGTSSHAVGTAKGVSTNEVQGSFSSLALILTGITTVVIAPLVVFILTLI